MDECICRWVLRCAVKYCVVGFRGGVGFGGVKCPAVGLSSVW